MNIFSRFYNILWAFYRTITMIKKYGLTEAEKEVDLELYAERRKFFHLTGRWPR